MTRNNLRFLHGRYHACGIRGLRFELAWMQFMWSARVIHWLNDSMQRAQARLARIVEEHVSGATGQAGTGTTDDLP